MKNTTVINLFGGPGIGKSTLMARIFAELKTQGFDCEMAPEFFKDLIWEERQIAMQDDLYTLAMQSHKIFTLNGKVDIIITDSPILLKAIYAKNDSCLSQVVINEFLKYNNLNLLLKRETEYQANGRIHNLESSIEIDKEIEKVFKCHNIPYSTISVNNIDNIIEFIKKKVIIR